MSKTKKSIELIIGLIIVVVAGGVIMGFLPLNRNKDITPKDSVKYVDELLNVDLSKKVQETTGDVKLVEGEEVAMIKMTLAKDEKEAVQKIIEEKLGQSIDVTTCKIPLYQNHKLAQDLKEKQLTGVYYLFKNGKKAKTRDITVYLADDEAGQSYLYCFG